MAFECVKQGHENARSACAQRMSERDRSPVDIHLCGIQAGEFVDSQRNNGKRFVDFKQIDVRDGEAALLQHFGDGIPS
ncbi:MAG: hypothetical protein H6Q32_818 [Bacteroidetes bacterium]|nr:hypothetical protein [Bacteroidota bacterium]